MIVTPVLAGTVALRDAARRLLVVAATVALLGHGGVELAPRPVAAGAGVLTASAATPTAKSQPVQPASTLRPSLAVPLGTSGGDPVVGPGPTPLVAPHLVVAPVARAATTSFVREAAGGVSGRAPPLTAGI